MDFKSDDKLINADFINLIDYQNSGQKLKQKPSSDWPRWTVLAIGLAMFSLILWSI